MNEISPVVLVFAGPNGSGKSTVTKGFDIIGEYINKSKDSLFRFRSGAKSNTVKREFS